MSERIKSDDNEGKINLMEVLENYRYETTKRVVSSGKDKKGKFLAHYCYGLLNLIFHSFC